MEPAQNLATPPARVEPARPSSVSTLPDFDRYRPRAGHPDWRRLMEEAKELAGRVRSQIDGPHSRRRELGRKAAAIRKYVAGFLANRKIAREGREDFRPFVLHWTTTRACNFRCVYCDDHLGRKYPDLSNRDVLNTAAARDLLRMMGTQASALYLAGGEPTLRKDLPELIRYAHELNYYPIILNTNAALFHTQLLNPAYRTMLSDLDHVVVSLDALDLDFLRKAWVTKKPEQVISNLLCLRELSKPLRFKLIINTVIMPGQVAHTMDVLNLASDLDIPFAPVPANIGAGIDAKIQEDSDYHELVRTVLERKRHGQQIVGSLRMNQRLLHADRLQCRPTLKPHIDFDGKLAWPCRAAVNMKPVEIDALDFNRIDDLYAHARDLVEPTRFHGPAKNQCGGNCRWTQYYATESYARGLTHPGVMLKEVLEFALQG